MYLEPLIWIFKKKKSIELQQINLNILIHLENLR